MLATRIATAAVVVPIAVLGMLFLPTGAIALVFSALMLLGAWEWGGLVRLETTGRGVFVAVVAAVMGLVLLLRNAPLPVSAELFVIGLACLWWLAAIAWIVRYPQGWSSVLGRLGPGAAVGVVALVAPVAAVTNSAFASRYIRE